MMQRFEVNLDGQIIVAFAEKVGGGFWLHVNGKNLFIPKEKKKFNRAKDAGEKTSLEISAPMPGKILKILKKSGDSVQKNETILIMEAMKMEYSLKASGEFQIKDILCAMGDQVPLGRKLVQFRA